MNRQRRTLENKSKPGTRSVHLALWIACGCLSGLSSPSMGEQFTDVTSSCGISIPETAGSRFEGIAWADCNNDGFLDLFIGGDDYSISGRGPSLYINQGPPDYAFVDYASSAGLDFGGCLSAAWVDFDADGDQDLLVSTALTNDGGRLLLLKNDGADPPSFEDYASTFGIQAASGLEIRFDLVDINDDGLLDLMVGRGGNNLNDGERRYSHFYLSTNLELYPYAIVQGLLNHQLEIADPRWVRAVAFCDFDADGDQDLYLAGYGYDKQRLGGLYVYDRYSGFSPHPDIAPDEVGDLVAWADFDNDEDFDLVSVISRSCRLHVNQGGLDFRLTESATSYGLVCPEPRDRFFEPKWADFDNDGYEDLYLTCWHTAQDWLFRNLGGTGFVDVSATSGLAIDNGTRMVAWGDYDNDGDMDVVMSHLYPPYIRLLRNNQDDDHYLKIVPVDEAGLVHNQQGAVVKLYLRTSQELGHREFVAMRTLGCTGGGFSQSQYVAHFGVDPTLRYYIRVIFPDGTVRDWNTNPGLGEIDPREATGAYLEVDTHGSAYIRGTPNTSASFGRRRPYE